MEKIIEVPVERKNYVERIYETFLEKPYDVIKENIVHKDNYLDIRESQVNFYMRRYPEA